MTFRQGFVSQMKYFLFVAVALSLLGCEDQRAIMKAKISNGSAEYQYDGCQYIVVSGGGICHKGNCLNPIHSEGSERGDQ